MSSKKVTKTINYFRVNFKEECPRALAHYLRQAHDKLPEVAQRTFLLGAQELKGCHYDHPTENEFYVHVTLTTPGESATIVPDAHGASHADLEQMAAPAQANFMDGDLWFYLNGNHLLFCSTQLPISRARDFIYEILDRGEQPETAKKFMLSQVADVDKIQMLQNGVSNITLGAGLFPATVRYKQRETVRNRLISRVVNDVISLFHSDPELKEYTDAENITAELVLKFNRRQKGSGKGQLRMKSLAEKIVEDDENEGFAIKTFNNEKLTPQNIVLRKPVKLEKNGKTVFHQDVWRCMNDYFNELRAKGLLEQ